MMNVILNCKSAKEHLVMRRSPSGHLQLDIINDDGKKAATIEVEPSDLRDAAKFLAELEVKP